MNKCTTTRNKPCRRSYALNRSKLIRLCLLTFSLVYLVVPRVQAQVKPLLITLSAEQLSLREIFRQIEQKGNVVINYSEEAVDATTKVSVKVEQVSVAQALQAALRNTPYEFVNSGGAYIIRRKPIPVPKKDPGKVTGKIIDEENGQPVIGATISIGNKGTTTDVEGSFSIPLSQGSYAATISYVGYGTKEVSEIDVKDNQVFELNITLKREKGSLAAWW